MRQIFTLRFFAAVGAVVGLFFLLTTIFATREAIEGDGGGATPIETHPVDLVEQVFSSRTAGFEIVAVEDDDDDGDARAVTVGVAGSDTELIIDGSRSVWIVAGTPGEMHCDEFGEIGACAIVADLLGEAVVWFAIVPMGSNGSVELPAIDVLDDGLATLVNGWRVRYASVLDRRCGDEEFASYVEFREQLGDDFVSIFSLDDRRLVAVECGARVPYAPTLSTTPDPDTDLS